MTSVVNAMGVLAILLVVAHLIAQVVTSSLGIPGDSRAAVAFHLDREGNIPTLFSSGMFLLNAILVLAVSKTARRAGELNRIWPALALIFCLLALDESFALHERLVIPLRTMLDTSGPFYFAWIIPYGIATALLSVVTLPTLQRMHRTPRRLFVLAAGTYVAGAIGCEMLSGYYVDSMDTYTSLSYQALMVCEETLEMAGLVLCMDANLELLRSRNVDLVINVPWSKQQPGQRRLGLCVARPAPLDRLDARGNHVQLPV